MIATQKWKEPQYTKNAINTAGKKICKDDISDEEKKHAEDIIDNWRAAHAYPLHVFYMLLRRHASSRNDIIVVERLKRLDSILGKLKRENGMNLCRMQDLGGCRMILPTIEDVDIYSKKVLNSRIRHEFLKMTDYINNPKKSGYRSLHLVYRFHSDSKNKQIYNDYPMIIELQYRTHLQHIWATAVETMGIFTNQALKAGQGNEAIKRFFVVASSLFALKEECPVVPETSDNPEILIKELKQIDERVHVLDNLKAIRLAIYNEVDNVPDKHGYYILKLDNNNQTLDCYHFMPSDYEKANKEYDELEKKSSQSNINVVLIRASSFSTVKDAYPNYFMDIGEFVLRMEEYMK